MPAFPPQGPPNQPPNNMIPPQGFQQGAMPPAYHQPRNGREWDNQPPFDDGRPDFKRRRYNEPFQGSGGGPPGPPPPPQGMPPPPQNMGMFPPNAAGYHPPTMGVPPGIPSQMQSMQPPFPYPPQMASQPTQHAMQGPPPPGMTDSFHNLPAPPRRDYPASDRKPDGPGIAGGSPGRSDAAPDEPMTFQEYIRTKPRNISPQSAQEGYENYKRDFIMQKPNRFFDEHMEEEWFRERYDPQYVRNRIKRVEVEVGARAVEFRRIWDQGGSKVCAPSLSAQKRRESRRDRGENDEGSPDERKPVLIMEDRKGDPKANEAEGAGGDEEPSPAAVQIAEAKLAFTELKEVNKSEEGVKEDVAGDAMAIGDDLKEGDTKKQGEVQTDVEAETKNEETVKPDDVKMETKEEPTDGSSNDVVKKEDSSESVKTDPNSDSATAAEESVGPKPDKSEGEVGTKSENIDPEQKDATVEKGEAREDSKEELKDEPTEDSITAPTVVPAEKKVTPEQEKDPRQRPESDLCLPLRRQHQKDTIFMRGIPRNLSRTALVKILTGGADGTANLTLRRLKLGDINPVRGLQRFGWAVYDSEETAKRALEIVRGTVVRTSDCCDGGEDERKKLDEDPEATYTIDCMLNMERRRKFNSKTLPIAFAEIARLKDDSVQAVRIMRHLDSLRKMDKHLNPFTDEFLSSLESDEERLDHVVSYLREVHYFCYYSGNEFLEDPTSMPPQEVLPVFYPDRAYSKSSEGDARMVRRVDERAKWVLERGYDRPRSNGDNGDAARASRLQAWLDANTKDEGNGRFRCRLPPKKLFKAPSFVHKHLKTKHPDAVADIYKKADMETYRANFENDASKAEVVAIFCEGITPGGEYDEYGADNGGSGMGDGMGNVSGGYPQGANMAMYGGGPFLGMGMQYPMMMMAPQAGATGFPPAYAGGFQPTGGMGFQGQGIGMGGMMPMQQAGGGGYRGRGGRGRERDGGRRSRGGWRGGRSEGYDDERGGESSPRRMRREGGRPKPKRYNDLDAPSDEPGMDLVRYDNI